MIARAQDEIPDQEGGQALLSNANGNNLGGNGLNEQVALQSSPESEGLVGSDELRYPWRYRVLAIFTAVGLVPLAVSLSFSFGSALVAKSGRSQPSGYWSVSHKEVGYKDGSLDPHVKLKANSPAAKLPTLPLSPSQLGVTRSRDLDDLDNENPDPELAQDVPMCVVNTVAAFFYLNQAGVEVARAADACPEEKIKDRDGKINCASSIWGVLQSFISTGSLVAALITQCAPSISLPADCVSVTLGLVGTIFQALESGLSSDSTCKAEKEVKDRNRLLSSNNGAGALTLWNTSQGESAKPRTGEGLSNSTEVVGLKAGWCWVNTGSAAAYLASIGTSINVLVKYAPCTGGGSLNQSGCAAVVAAVFGAVANSVAYLAGSASQCSKTMLPGADCTADWSTIVNSLASIASAGAQFNLICGQIGNERTRKEEREGRGRASPQDRRRSPPYRPPVFVVPIMR